MMKQAILMATVTVGASLALAQSQAQQTFRGVLMDATCAPIVQSRATGDPSRSQAGLTDHGTGVTDSFRTQAVTGPFGSEAPALQGERQTGTGHDATHGQTGDTQTGERRARAAGQGDRQTGQIATGRTEAGTRQGVTDQSKPEQERSRTGDQTANERTGSIGVDQSAGATSGAGSASAHGTTGAAVITPPGAAPGGADQGAGRTVTTVREHYRDCQPSVETTSFALHADGKLYLFDQASNEKIRQQMRNEAFRGSMTDRSGTPQWISVSVTGQRQDNDVLSIESVRR